LNVGGEWIYDEFASGAGVTSVGLEEKAPAPPTEEEKKGILDLFKN
jgi:penicillin-binding protein 1A